MTLSKSGFALRTRSFSWISRSSDALAEQSADPASAQISGSGSGDIAA